MSAGPDAPPRDSAPMPATGSPAAKDTLLPRRTLHLLLAGLIAAILAGQALLAWRAFTHAETLLLPEIEKKTATLGLSVGEQIERALSFRIPVDRLAEMEPFLQDHVASDPDIHFLAVLTAKGQQLYLAGEHPAGLTDLHLPAEPAVGDRIRRTSPGYILNLLPLFSSTGLAGWLVVGMPDSVVTDRIAGILYQVGTVVIVTALIGIELLLLVMWLGLRLPLERVGRAFAAIRAGDYRAVIPVAVGDEIGRFARQLNRAVGLVNERQRDLELDAQEARLSQIDQSVAGRIDDLLKRIRRRFRFAEPGAEQPVVVPAPATVRVPLFLFIMSEELSRAFLPLFIEQLTDPAIAIGTDIAIGLPITIFMLVVAALTPMAGHWCDRYGPRSIFMVGAAVSAAGYVGTWASGGLYEFIGARSVSAAGYALVFIAAQAYVTRTASPDTRAQAGAQFVGAVFAGMICGPAVGGILADRVGYRETFLVALALALLAALIALVVLQPTQAARRPAAAGQRLKGYLRLMSDRAFIGITFFAAIPAKFLLAGLLFYLTPLYLSDLGADEAMIGRVLMLYGLVTVLLNPLFARVADAWGNRAGVVAAGGLLAALGCLVADFLPPLWIMVAVVVSMGLGHAAIFSAQLAVVQGVAAGYRDSVGEASVLALFRLLERLGTALGPLTVAALVALTDAFTVVIAAGVFGLLCTLGFLWLVRPRHEGAVAAAAVEPHQEALP